MNLNEQQIQRLKSGAATRASIMTETGLPRREVSKAIAVAIIEERLPRDLLSLRLVREYYDVMTTGENTLRRATRKYGSETTPAPTTSAPKTTPAKLAEAGYDTERPAKTPAEAWAEHRDAFERKVSKTSKDHVIQRADCSPFVIYHVTDPHLDDDATPLALIEADIQASHEMGAIMIHGGDALNNWPSGGRLAAKWGEQACTLEDSLLRLRHYIDMLRADVWVDGNHEEMSTHLPHLIAEMLAGSSTIRDYWRADVTIKSPGGRDLRLAVSHKFSKGKSWFHALQGHIREALEGPAIDLLLDGHMHQAGVLEQHLPERGTTTLCVASAGYKVVDNFATRISRGGKSPRIRGRAHWIVVDPLAPAGAALCTAFSEPEQAAAYKTGLEMARRIAA